MNSYSKRSIAITVAVSFIVSLLFNVFVEWQRYESYVDTYTSPAQHSGNFRGLPNAPLTLEEKGEMLLHTGSDKTKTTNDPTYYLLTGTTRGGIPIDPPTFLEKVALFLYTGEFYDSDDGSNYRRPSGTTTGGLPIDQPSFWQEWESAMHAAEVESKTKAKKPENAEKHDDESQTP